MEIKKLLKTLLEEAEFYEEEASDHGWTSQRKTESS